MKPPSNWKCISTHLCISWGVSSYSLDWLINKRTKSQRSSHLLKKQEHFMKHFAFDSCVGCCHLCSAALFTCSYLVSNDLIWLAVWSCDIRDESWRCKTLFNSDQCKIEHSLPCSPPDSQFQALQSCDFVTEYLLVHVWVKRLRNQNALKHKSFVCSSPSGNVDP